jgi:phosphatidylserine/phosphatidylglycerophosphate/cardiolipin synthase-like enzyme
VICAAYVGQDCLDFIPFAKGITVYCSKEPGATSADGLDRLISRGATVYFVRNLHAKLYWTEGVGVVIGSSNLTSNGMDDDRLIECGVFIPDSSAIDPRRLIRGKGKRATPADIAELRRMSGLLRIARREVLGRGTGAATGGRISAPVTFDEWMTFAGPRTLRVAEFEAAMEWSTEGSEFVKDKWG